jgi:hypothetical protein
MRFLSARCAGLMGRGGTGHDRPGERYVGGNARAPGRDQCRQTSGRAVPVSLAQACRPEFALTVVRIVVTVLVGSDSFGPQFIHCCKAGSDPLRPSRRPLRGLLRMRNFFQCHPPTLLILRSPRSGRLEGRNGSDPALQQSMNCGPKESGPTSTVTTILTTVRANSGRHA